MTTATLGLAPLLPYPSFHARSQLSHTQLSSLNQKISQSIQQTLDLPQHALNTAAPAAAFVSSYARDVAQRNLDALIWDADPKTAAKSRPETTEARTIHARTLLLAERLASTGAQQDPTTLLDLSIAYASQPTRLRALYTNAFTTTNSAPLLLTSTAASALPAFTSVLRSHSTIGLHGLRKTAHAILCLLRVAPRELLLAFAHSRDFTLALAQAYDAGLGAASSSYGRLYYPPVAGAPQREPDDWEVLFLRTKVDLLDAFHILFTALLDALAALPPADPSLPAEAERAFDAISALQALPAPPRRPDGLTPPTPFLNRSLLADYQHAYDLSGGALLRTLRHAVPADDARLECLSAVLREFDAELGGGEPSAAGLAPRRGDPGAFRLLLGSSVHYDVDGPGRGGATRTGEGTAAVPSGAVEVDTVSGSSRVVDPRVEEVRAILPDYKPEYIEALLQRTEYGSVERVVEALLDGTAPPPEAIQQQHATSKAQTSQTREEFEYTRDRRNVFDEEDMDISNLRIGKKGDDAMTVLGDRSFMDQMKTDILRRIEAPSDSEDEKVDIFGGVVVATGSRSKGKGKMREVAFDDELEDVGSVRVAGDGEESSADEDYDDGDDDEDERDDEPEMTPQVLVELAYIANPKVFERDAATRRSKERIALRAQTGWVDEQIEGFRIMLDRDPKMKEKMLARHEFSGNKPHAGLSSFSRPSARSRSRSGTPDPQRARGRGDGGRGRRGQTRGRGPGRGRGEITGPETGGGGGSGDGGDARGRAWKDKNKARHANHDRKRGHDKKMAKAGGPS